MKTGILTQRALDTLKPGEWASEAGARGDGRLQARKLGSGSVAFYYRYTGSDGSRHRIPLGTGTLADARKAREAYKDRYQSGDRDLREVLAAEAADVAAAKAVAAAEAEAATARARATLGVLLEAYVANMRKAGKSSAEAVLGCVHRHVRDALPRLWAKPAADVTADDLMDAVARLADADKLREAAKLRSYLRAAYAAGVRAKHNAKAIKALRELRLSHNPAADLASIEGGTRARERALSVAELRHYWRRIAAMPGEDGALLRFHLLTGCQRVEQLARLQLSDVENGRIRIRDTKGRRVQARIHVVPLLPEAAEALKAMQGGVHGPYAFTVTQGLQGASYGVVQNRVRDVCAAMQEAGELSAGTFTPGDLRRTVETRLAAAGVSLEIRAQLQSHGLGGVQAKHYDRHDYMSEKREALETLHRLASADPATVTPIRKRVAVKSAQ
ncbi:MAG: integrase family protein [Xanthomonadaceae bacterium]|nr:integrase family protein [Xanthomonadaceae bacterium]